MSKNKNKENDNKAEINVLQIISTDNKPISGGTSTVYRFKHNNETKVLKLASLIKASLPLVEVSIMHSLIHPHLMPAMRYIPHKECPAYTVGIVMPQARMDLLDFCMLECKTKNNRLEERARFLYHAACGLRVLHNNNLIHGDVKPENVFLVEGRAVLGDFGHVAPLSKERKDLFSPVMVGSNGYYPIDLSDNSFVYNKSTDIWSLGLMIYSVMSGRGAYAEELNGCPDKDIYSKWKKFVDTYFSSSVIGKMLNHCLPDSPHKKSLLDLIPRMLAYEAKNRPTIEEVLAHPFFAPFYDDTIAHTAKPIINPTVKRKGSILRTLEHSFSQKSKCQEIFNLACNLAQRSHMLLEINDNNIRLYEQAYIALASAPINREEIDYILIPPIEEIMRVCGYTIYDFSVL